jgi:hypothetical protein
MDMGRHRPSRVHAASQRRVGCISDHGHAVCVGVPYHGDCAREAAVCSAKDEKVLSAVWR